MKLFSRKGKLSYKFLYLWPKFPYAEPGDWF